jgi:hypothetical protein
MTRNSEFPVLRSRGVILERSEEARVVYESNQLSLWLLEIVVLCAFVIFPIAGLEGR